MNDHGLGTHQFSFPKSEKLSSQKAVKDLFSKGDSFFIFPYKIIFRFPDSNIFHHQILISVPRNFSIVAFKRSVSRKIDK